MSRSARRSIRLRSCTVRRATAPLVRSLHVHVRVEPSRAEPPRAGQAEAGKRNETSKSGRRGGLPDATRRTRRPKLGSRQHGQRERDAGENHSRAHQRTRASCRCRRLAGLSQPCVSLRRTGSCSSCTARAGRLAGWLTTHLYYGVQCRVWA